MTNRKTTTVFIIAVSIFGVALAAFVYLAYTLEKQADKLTEVIQTLTNEEMIRREQQNLAALLTQIAPISDELYTYIVAGDDGTVDFLSEVDAYAARYGVELSTRELEVEEQKGDFNTLLVTFAIKGDETAVRQMVEALEVWPLAGEVRRVSFKRIAAVDEESAPQVESTISLALSIMDL